MKIAFSFSLKYGINARDLSFLNPIFLGRIRRDMYYEEV